MSGAGKNMNASEYHGSVKVTLPDTRWKVGEENYITIGAEDARALASELVAAAKDAETEPRFSEEDLRLIQDISNAVWGGHRCGNTKMLLDGLKTIRKPRGDS